MSAAWSRLMGGVGNVTAQLTESDISEELLLFLLTCLYLNYDISKPYIEQVEQNMDMVKAVFKTMLHKEISFQPGNIESQGEQSKK